MAGPHVRGPAETTRPEQNPLNSADPQSPDPAPPAPPAARRRPMNPRLFSGFAIALSLTVLLGTLYGISAVLIMGQSRAIEQESMERDLSRASDSLADYLTGLSSKAGDWANWDDTYYFMVDRNQDFLDVNPTDTSFEQLGLNYMALVAPDGEIAFAKAYDLAAHAEVPVPRSLVLLLGIGSPLLEHHDVESEITGVVELIGGPVLVASRPILTSNAEGPIRGSLIFGRMLDSEFVAGLANETHLNLSLVDLADPGHPAQADEAGRALAAGAAVYLYTPDGDTLGGFTPLRDLSGHVVRMLYVESPRTVVAQGRTSLFYFGAALVGMGLLAGVVTQVLVDRLVLSRLAKKETEARFRAVVEQAGEGIALIDPESRRILEANQALADVLRIPRDLLVRMTLDDFGKMEPQALEGFRMVLYDGGARRRSLRWPRADGEVLELEASATPIQFDGRPVLSMILRDVTEQNRSERALRASEERYALASRGANDGLWDWDLRADRIHFSERWKAMLGYREEEVTDRPSEWFDRVHPDDREKLQAALSAHRSAGTPHLQSEHRLLHHDGTYRWVMCRGLAVRNGNSAPHRMAGSISDITDRKRAEERLTFDALHDGLTGLPNRALFLDRLERALERARRHPEAMFSVLFLDLDRFKVVNDSLGHMSGDMLLVEIGKRLGRVTRQEDTVARLGGDEFALLLEHVRDTASVTRFVERIHASLGSPVTLGGQEAFVSASIGIAMYDPRYQQPEEILRDADIAMYRAKESGRARHEVYDSRLHAQAASQLRRETELRRGLERGEIQVHYQPVFDIRSGRITALEALARWQHPERGLLLPAEFIPLAEESGLIVSLGSFVLREACRQLVAWQADGVAGRDHLVSVNVSSRQFADAAFVDTVATILQETGLAPASLYLEITETVILENAEASASMMNRLKRLGVRLALDDFGTGYSALSYLHRFPIDSLKVDRSFISDLVGSSSRAAIVGAIVTLAHNLRLDVVAEGIETEAQRDTLRALACEFGQGFLYSRPLAPEAARGLLQRQAQPVTAA